MPHLKFNLGAPAYNTRKKTSLFMSLNPKHRPRSTVVQNLYNKSSFENFLNILFEKLIDFPSYIRASRSTRLRTLLQKSKRRGPDIQISVTPPRKNKLDCDQIKKEIQKKQYSEKLEKLEDEDLNRIKEKNLDQLYDVVQTTINREMAKCNSQKGGRE